VPRSREGTGPTERVVSIARTPDVSLVDDAIHLFHVPDVGDDLYIGHDVLQSNHISCDCPVVHCMLGSRSYEHFARTSQRATWTKVVIAGLTL